MKNVFILFFTFLSIIGYSQNVGINNTDPQTSLDIDGLLRLRRQYWIVTNNFPGFPSNFGSFVVMDGAPTPFTTFLPTRPYGSILFLENRTSFNATVNGFTIEPSKLIMFIYGDVGWKPINLGSIDWTIIGNSDTDANVNFIGTSDDEDVVFKRNNLEKLRLLNNGVAIDGEMGINTLTPKLALDVKGGFRNQPLYLTGSGTSIVIPANESNINLAGTFSGPFSATVTNPEDGQKLIIDNNSGQTGLLSGTADIRAGLNEYTYSDGEWKVINTNAWGLSGNSNTDPSNNFIGTTDNQDLRFKVNNNEQLRLTSTLGEFAGNLFVKNRIETPGTIKLGSFDAIAEAGKIRYNTTSNDFEGYNGTAWRSFTSTGSGFTLPYNANYGLSPNPAFRINVQSNTTGIEVNNIALAGATEPAFRATSGGLSVVEIESTSLSKTSIGMLIQNNQPTAAGINTSIGVVSDSAVALSVSGINNALVVNGSSTGSKASVSILNLGQGQGMKVEQINSTSTQNAMHITSSSKGSALKVEVNKTLGQQAPNAANALEIGNGFIKVDQTAPFRSVFKHVTNAFNVNGNATSVFYSGALPTDILFVQKSLPYIGTGVLVWWDPSLLVWKIANEINTLPMPIDVTFNVMVIKTQ